MALDPEARFVPVDRVKARRVGDEMILLHLGQGSYFSLNEVGADVWEGLGEGLTVEDLLGRLLDRYEVGEETLRDDVEDVIRELVERGLVAPEEADGERAKGRKGERA